MPRWVDGWLGSWLGDWLGQDLPAPDKNTDTPLERTRFPAFPTRELSCVVLTRELNVPVAVRELTVPSRIRELMVPQSDRDEDAHEYEVR